MALPSEIIKRRDKLHGSKLGDRIRQLSSDNDGVVVAAVYAVRRLLESHGVTILALADHIENGGLSKDDMEKIKAKVEQARLEGYAEGVRAAEAKQHGTGEFRNTDGKLEWSEVALFLQREKHRLDPRHHQFVDDMASRTAWGREPTPRQHQYLHSLLLKLGGPGAIT
jgi:hypothetical protein